MAYLEELLPEFRNGAKIRKKHWHEKVYLYYKNGLIYDYHNQVMYNFSAKSLSSDNWEFYKEPIDWNYIIENNCLCWFWDDENDENFIATLEAFEIDTCVTSFKSKNGAVWHNCRPVQKDEVTFYDNKKDE